MLWRTFCRTCFLPKENYLKCLFCLIWTIPFWDLNDLRRSISRHNLYLEKLNSLLYKTSLRWGGVHATTLDGPMAQAVGEEEGFARVSSNTLQREVINFLVCHIWHNDPCKKGRPWPFCLPTKWKVGQSWKDKKAQILLHQTREGLASRNVCVKHDRSRGLVSWDVRYTA